jgi:hypothetical protein
MDVLYLVTRVRVRVRVRVRTRVRTRVGRSKRSGQ